MKLHFLSSLHGQNELGGAYLRNSAIKQIYALLGLDVLETFTGNVETYYGPGTLWYSLKYGLKARNLFKCSALQGPHVDYYHYDTLKHFHWKISPSAPIIYNAHNLEFENYISKSLGPAARKLLNREIECMLTTLQTFVCSDRERDILIRQCPKLEKKVFVLPNLVNASNYQASLEKKYISFIGSLDYPPNIEALEFIMSNIDAFKDPSGKLKLLVAGKNISDSLANRLSKVGIQIMQNLESSAMFRVFSETEILLVPLMSGSGTRLKIIEALLSGAKVISTELGAEGLPKDIVKISSLDQFPSDFQTLLKSKNQEHQEHIDKQNLKLHFDIESWYSSHATELKKRLLLI